MLWQDGIVAFFAAVGVLAILWALCRAVLFLPPRRAGVVALLCVRDDGAQIEQQVRELRFLRRESDVVGEILLIDCGLSDEGMRICRILARSDRRITLCKSDEIEKYLKGELL